MPINGLQFEIPLRIEIRNPLIQTIVVKVIWNWRHAPKFIIHPKKNAIRRLQFGHRAGIEIGFKQRAQRHPNGFVFLFLH